VLLARSGIGRGEPVPPTRTPVVAAAPTPTVASVAAAAPAVRPTSKPTAIPTRQTRPTVEPTRAQVRTATPRPTSEPTRVAAITPEPTHPIATNVEPTHVAAFAIASSTPTAPTASAAASGAVELTFDAGADRGYAEDILDVLADAHVVASFGITGNWAKANPDLVRRMAADGHLVFNHTLDHRSFTGVSDSLGGLSADKRRAELDQADAIIAPLIGHSTRPYFRLPYGDDDAHVTSDVGSIGYSRKIGWTVDSEGWRGLQADDILARCVKLAAPNAVYVFHVGRASQEAIALPRIINDLRERGFTFRRIDQG